MLSPRGITGLLVATLVCWTGFAVVSVVVSARGDGIHRGLILVAVVGVLVLQILHCLPRAQTWPCSRRAVSLAGQAALTYVALAAPTVGWASTAGFLAASFAILLPSRVAWAVASAVPASVLVLPPLLGHSWLATAYLAASTVISGVAILSLVALRELAAGAHSAGQAMARTAVVQERRRFARDLHDHLGNTLSAVALRCEVAQRLLPDSPAAARRELGDVVGLARQALADVRSLVPGERRLSAAAEARAAAAMLRAAGVDVDVSTRWGLLPDHVETVLATVLREGATNVFRHSAARRCRITGQVVEGQAVVELVNDGVDGIWWVDEESLAGAAWRVGTSGGAGLRNLRARTEELGGTVSAGPAGDGSFRLVASIPLRPAVGPVSGAPGLRAISAAPR